MAFSYVMSHMRDKQSTATHISMSGIVNTKFPGSFNVISPFRCFIDFSRSSWRSKTTISTCVVSKLCARSSVSSRFLEKIQNDRARSDIISSVSSCRKLIVLLGSYWRHQRDESSYTKDLPTLPRDPLPRHVVFMAFLPRPRLSSRLRPCLPLRSRPHPFSISSGVADWGWVVNIIAQLLSRRWESPCKDACSCEKSCGTVVGVLMDKFSYTSTTAGSASCKVCVDWRE